MQDFKKLDVWKKPHTFAVEIYKTTATFPKNELYGLTSQTRRASISIPTNIAEGCGRGGGAELSHFLKIALGSASESEYLLLLASELNYLNLRDYGKFDVKVTEIKRMLTALIQKIEN
jgi:four helix bundle protein